jgi:hypothetical protein
MQRQKENKKIYGEIQSWTKNETPTREILPGITPITDQSRRKIRGE